MKEHEASENVGYVVRKMHNYEMEPYQAELIIKPYMADPICAGILMARFESAIRTNQEVIRHAQNRNAALVDLRDRISGKPR
jgi:hypothetical protein